MPVCNLAEISAIIVFLLATIEKQAHYFLLLGSQRR